MLPQHDSGTAGRSELEQRFDPGEGEGGGRVRRSSGTRKLECSGSEGWRRRRVQRLERTKETSHVEKSMRGRWKRKKAASSESMSSRNEI